MLDWLRAIAFWRCRQFNELLVLTFEIKQHFLLLFKLVHVKSYVYISLLERKTQTILVIFQALDITQDSIDIVDNSSRMRLWLHLRLLRVFQNLNRLCIHFALKFCYSDIFDMFHIFYRLLQSDIDRLLAVFTRNFFPLELIDLSRHLYYVL